MPEEDMTLDELEKKYEDDYTRLLVELTNTGGNFYEHTTMFSLRYLVRVLIAIGKEIAGREKI